MFLFSWKSSPAKHGKSALLTHVLLKQSSSIQYAYNIMCNCKFFVESKAKKFHRIFYLLEKQIKVMVGIF